MCGIAGGTAYDEASISEALRLTAHRGRDASKSVYYPEAALWLGHNRLAIQDLSSAADQPFESDTCSLVFNGELWRRTLEEYSHLRGARTEARTSTSDTELLALMYEEYGDNVLDFARRLDGMFAFAIYDRRRRCLVLGRDRMGRIPLYFLKDACGALAFASEAKALCGPMGAAFAGNGTQSQRKSEVKLFPPGAIMTVDLSAKRTRGSERLEVFASLDEHRGECVSALDARDRGLDYYVAGLRERLEAAVLNELVADVPVCTILSGGVDSTLITMLLSRHYPNLKAYTVTVDSQMAQLRRMRSRRCKDDLYYARLAADAIGIPLVEVRVPYEEAVAALEDVVWGVEDARWVQVAPAVPQVALAKRIGADGYKVVFGGEGADELFGSYADTRRWYWEPQAYCDRRLHLCGKLHDNNLIRGNKAMMYGGTVELRTPFLDREVVDHCLHIPTRYRANMGGSGKVMKPVLRAAFEGALPRELLMRPKVTFQEGAHSDFFKGYKEVIQEVFQAQFC